MPVDSAQVSKAPHSTVRGGATAFTDIISVSGARVLSMCLALASATIVTHLLRPAQYSILAYIGVISALMFTVTASWTATAVTRYGREELERSGSMRSTSWSRLIVTMPLVAIAISLVSVLKVAGMLPSELSWGFVAIAAATGIVLIASEHMLNLLEASGRMTLTATGLALQRVLSIAAILGLAAFGAARSPTTIALVWLVVGCLFAAGLGKTVWSAGLWPATLDRVLFRRLVMFSIPMIAFAVSQYVVQAVDVVILGAFRSARDVGVYAIAYQGYGMLQQVATTATIVLSPLFVSLKLASRESVIAQFYDRTVAQVLLLCSIGAGIMAPLTRTIVSAIFGHAFSDAATPLIILLVAWSLFAAASFVAPILVLHERSRAMGLISVVTAIVNVGADLLLVGVFGVGIEGPAIATTIALAVLTAGYFRVAAESIARNLILPVGMLAPVLTGVGVTLAVPGLTGAAIAVGATVSIAVVVFAALHPFAAEDADFIDKLNIPGPIRKPLARALERLPKRPTEVSRCVE